MGYLAVAAVDTDRVLMVLEPIWRVKPETAGPVRRRIECILDHAKARDWRTGENPARWRDHLDHLVPSRAKIVAVEHHAALLWSEVAGFMAELAGRDSVAAKAMTFLILTAARTSEALGATWGEIDMSPPREVVVGRDDKGEPINETVGACWTVPAARMKGNREHRAPLSDAALAVLGEVAVLRCHAGADAPVFPGRKLGKPLSAMTLLTLLRRIGHRGLTVHGFRSTFRDWVAEATIYQRELAEVALAHALVGKTQAAYQRGDLLEKRRRVMADWSRYCTAPEPAGRVVAFPMAVAG